MKSIQKILVAILIILVSVTFVDCSNKSSGYNYRAHRNSSPTIKPVETKHEPVRKNFIVPQKKKKILGQQTPKI